MRDLGAKEKDQRRVIDSEQDGDQRADCVVGRGDARPAQVGADREFGVMRYRHKFRMSGRLASQARTDATEDSIVRTYNDLIILG